MAGWSSLPGDLVNHIADRLLATDDLDYYMDLRAVCRGWCSSTADPKSSPRDPRFRPRQWAMLEEVHQSDARLFVMVVLAKRTAPHAARVLNPFTGAMISFEAPVPAEWKVVAHVIGSSPTLVLLCQVTRTIYWADPDSESFMALEEINFANPLIRLALEGGIYAASREDGSLESLLFLEAKKILDLTAEPFAVYFAGGAEGEAGNNRCFLVESAGEMLIVCKLPHGIEVFKMDTRINLLERVKNLGSRALFVGDCRCLSVDADKFASVEANCIYYVVVEPCFDVCVYSLNDEKDVRAGGAIDSFNHVTLSVDPPFLNRS